MIYNPYPLFGYNFHEGLFVQDHFMNQSASSGTIGDLGFATLQGTTTVVAGEDGHPGIVRRSTGTTTGTVSTMKLGTSDVSFLPANTHAVLWVVRPNTVDANTALRIGSFHNSVADPFTNGIYLEKLTTDTNWFTVTRSGGSQTRNDTGLAAGTAWVVIAYTRDALGVQFYLNYNPVGPTHTTNIPTAGLHPGTCIINAENAAKTIDHDYFQFEMKGFAL